MAFPPTDWGGWTPEEYEVGAPATSNHFERWFRNPAAMAQGAAGAPGIWLRALNKPAAGDVEKVVRAATGSHSAASGTVFQQLAASFMGWGEARFKIEARRTSGAGGTILLQRVREGVTTTLASYNVAGSWAEFVVDASWRPFDTLELVHISPASPVTVETRNRKICTDGADLWMSSYAPEDVSLSFVAPEGL